MKYSKALNTMQLELSLTIATNYRFSYLEISLSTPENRNKFT